jgi:hypothetical protein
MNRPLSRPMNHAVRHGGHGYADDRHHHRQRGVAAHAGCAVGIPGPDRMSIDGLHRGRGHRDTAHRLAGRSLRRVTRSGGVRRGRVARACDNAVRRGCVAAV